LDKKKSILIVDDDKAVLGVIKDILELQGYRVDTAETGQEALEKTKTRYYNLALLDIKLPDIEGTQLLTKMHRDIPKMMKIMITGYASLENAVESLNLGADAYLMKPI
jgi:DNA-binding response OmpR family regulator